MQGVIRCFAMKLWVRSSPVSSLSWTSFLYPGGEKAEVLTCVPTSFKASTSSFHRTFVRASSRFRDFLITAASALYNHVSSVEWYISAKMVPGCGELDISRIHFFSRLKSGCRSWVSKGFPLGDDDSSGLLAIDVAMLLEILYWSRWRRIWNVWISDS